MAEFKIDGRMKVKKLKEDFFNEFGGVLRVYNGKSKADDDASLASIRSNDVAKGGELLCRGNRSVKSFKQEMWDIFGIKVQVATKDDWIIVLDGITLSKIKDIPNYASKESMLEFVGNVAKKTKEVGTTLLSTISKIKDAGKNAVSELKTNRQKEDNVSNDSTGLDNSKDPYKDILKRLDGKPLIYIPTYELNDDGCGLDEVSIDFPDDAYSQMTAVIGDYENGEISCHETCNHVDVSRDGMYFDSERNAVAVLGGKIISAVYEVDDEEFLQIGDKKINTNDI